MDFVEKYGNLPLKKNASTLTSHVAPRTVDHPAWASEKAIERKACLNYPFSDGMHFCADHSRNSDVVDVCECKNCYAVTPVRDLEDAMYRLDKFQIAHDPLFTQVKYTKQLMDAAKSTRTSEVK